MQYELKTFTECPSDEDWRIAVHESGHAVFAALNNLPFHEATLHPESTVDEKRDTDGKDCVDPIASPLDDDNFHGSIDDWQAFYAAGAAAECILLDGVIRKHGIRRDEWCHQRLNEKHGLSSDFSHAIQSAVATLAVKRQLLEQVAMELKRHRRLVVDRVYEILGISPPWESY